MSQPTKEEVKKAQEDIARAFVEAQLDLLYLTGHKELEYVKTAVHTPGGGIYLLSFLHIDGPKINVQDFGIKESSQVPPEDTL